MSLARAKIVYYAVIAALAILLALIGSLMDWVAAGALLVAAPILLKVICLTSAQETRNRSESTLDLIIAESDAHPSMQAPYPKSQDRHEHLNADAQ